MALSVTLGFHAQFTASKVGKTGLTPTIDIKSVKKSDGTITAVVTGGSTTENWRGVYFYRLTGADPETYDYEAVFITADATVDQKEVPALWTQYSVAVVTAGGHVSNLDAYTGNTPQTGDAYAATTTILNRLGAWTGTGINTILGALRALAAKAAALTPTDLSSGNTYDNTKASLEVLAAANGSLAGPGATACIVEIKNGGIPVPQAEVWLTSDQAGSTVVAGTLLTDSNGNVTFMLTVGNTYYVWMRKDGFNPIRGATYVATAG